jgi:XTP/dITP diphosphohydrolase
LSARYAMLFGQPKTDADNNRVLLEKMQSVTDRGARFVSALVAVRSADDPEPLVAMGRWHGQLLSAPQGAQGFGYDPLLFIPAFNCSVAELSAELKNQHSHRALAAVNMLAQMRDVWRAVSHLG